MLKFIEVKEKNDIETVVLLADTVWKEHYGGIISTAQIEYMLKNFQSYAAIKHAVDKGNKYYIMDYDGVPVGYLAVERIGNKLYLDKLYLLKEKRGQQIGGAAVDFVRKLAENEGCKSIYLTVNKHNVSSIKAYKSYGFVTESAVVTDIGNGFVMDDYQMYLYI